MASLFSSLCSKGPVKGSTPPPSASSNANARCFQNDPQHDGVVSGTLAPPLVRLWTIPTGSVSLDASPIVANGRVFVLLADPSGLALHALDEMSGTDIWNAPPAVPDDSVGLAFNDGLVAVASDTSVVTVFSAATGAKVWSLALPSNNATTNGGNMPVMANGQVYFTEHGIGGHMYAFDEKTGNRTWSLTTSFVSNDDGFSGIAVAPSTIVAASDDNILHAFSIDGMPLWATTASSAEFFGSVAVSGQTIVATSNIVSIFSTFDLRTGNPLSATFPAYAAPALDGRNGFFLDSMGNIDAFDLTTAHPLWTFSGHQVLIGSPLVVKGVVYMQADAHTRLCGMPVCLAPTGILHALSETTGAELWSDPVLPADMSSSPSYSSMASDGTVLVVGSGGNLTAYGSMTAPDAGAASDGGG
jgi:outer membrane protein assembly factor BamB